MNAEGLTHTLLCSMLRCRHSGCHSPQQLLECVLGVDILAAIGQVVQRQQDLPAPLLNIVVAGRWEGRTASSTSRSSSKSSWLGTTKAYLQTGPPDQMVLC